MPWSDFCEFAAEAAVAGLAGLPPGVGSMVGAAAGPAGLEIGIAVDVIAEWVQNSPTASDMTKAVLDGFCKDPSDFLKEVEDKAEQVAKEAYQTIPDGDAGGGGKDGGSTPDTSTNSDQSTEPPDTDRSAYEQDPGYNEGPAGPSEDEWGGGGGGFSGGGASGSWGAGTDTDTGSNGPDSSQDW